MKSWIAASIAVLLAAGGCVFKEYRETAEYDLAPAAAPTVVRNISVMEFRNESTSGPRMQRLLASGQVERDPYNRWVLEPGELVGRGLNSRFDREKSSAAPRLLVRGKLRVFEYDAAGKCFRLAGAFCVGEADKFGGTPEYIDFDIRVPQQEFAPARIAAAASIAVTELALRIDAAAPKVK